MGYYNDIALEKAIKEAEGRYDWDIDYTLIESQEIGGGGVVELYSVDIEGQYAEDDAEDFFRDFGFYSVTTWTTDYSFCTLHIELQS